MVEGFRVPVMRSFSFVAVLASAILLPAAASAAQPSFKGDMRQVEAGVLAAFNAVRSQPAAYIGTLTAYRGFFKANLVIVPGRGTAVQTNEGRAPVDETITFLKSQAPLATLQPSDMLRLGAADHLAEQTRTGDVGHYGADGSSPGERVSRHGGGEQVAEVIAYGAVDAKDVILQLLVDDGVPDRGHRIVMMADHLRYAGVACGPHPQYGTMCVIDMADTPDGSFAYAPSHVHVAAMDNTRRH